MSGGRYWQVLPKITLPLLRPAILSGLLLLFIMGMSSYEVPRLIGRPARIDVFTTEIQSATSSAPPEFGVASALSLTLLVICIVAVYFYRRATRNAEAFATITGKGYKPTRIELGRWRWPVAGAIGFMFLVALGLPLFTLAWQSFFRNLSQPFMGSTVAGDLGKLSLHPQLPGLPRRSAHQRRRLRHGGDRRRRAHVGDGLDRAALGVAFRLAARCAGLGADRDPERDRRRQHPVHLSGRADPGLQHDLDSAHRLRDAVPALRHALCLERHDANPSRAGGGGRKSPARRSARFSCACCCR